MINPSRAMLGGKIAKAIAIEAAGFSERRPTTDRACSFGQADVTPPWYASKAEHGRDRTADSLAEMILSLYG